MAKKHKGQSASFMRSINPHLKHSSSAHRKINKRGSVNFSMARKRRSSRRSYTRFAKRRYSRHSGGGIDGLALGTGVYFAYSLFAEPMISSAIGESIEPIVEVAGGYLLSKNKNKYVRDFGKVAFVVGLLKLGHTYITPMIGGASSSGSSFSGVPLN
jgi:hypothetical protein